jgi:parvulin-like peptidyl-prolyl isomerase
LSRLQDLIRSNEVDPEARNRFLLIAGMVGIVAFALALIAYGYYADRIAPRGDTVFTVGEREFSYAYLEDRVDAAMAEGRFVTSDITFGIAQVVSDLQNEELIRLIAAEDGVTISDEELDLGMREDVGVPADADRNVFANALRDRLQLLGLSLDRYEDYIEPQLLRQKVEAQLASGLPSEAEQVDLSVILVETDAQAAIARQRISDGESFEDVAGEVSTHSSSSDGGVLGWTPRELLVEDLAEAAFAQEPGTVSNVIETEDGFYIVRVAGKEVRTLDEATKTRYATTLFNDRLEAASEQYELQNLVTIEQAQRIANRIQSAGG